MHSLEVQRKLSYRHVSWYSGVFRTWINVVEW